MSRTKTQRTRRTRRTQRKHSINFTARIIIKDNIIGIGADKDTIKEILENIGGKVEVIVFNNVKKSISKYKNVNIQIFIEHIFL